MRHEITDLQSSELDLELDGRRVEFWFAHVMFTFLQKKYINIKKKWFRILKFTGKWKLTIAYV